MARRTLSELKVLLNTNQPTNEPKQVCVTVCMHVCVCVFVRLEKLRLERERMKAERARMELERERHRQERELEQQRERERLERQHRESRQQVQQQTYRQYFVNFCSVSQYDTPRCSGVKGSLRNASQSFICRCCKADSPITDGLNTDFHLDTGNVVSLEKVDKFCYLGDTLDAGGGCDSAVTN